MTLQSRWQDEYRCKTEFSNAFHTMSHLRWLMTVEIFEPNCLWEKMGRLTQGTSLRLPICTAQQRALQHDNLAHWMVSGPYSSSSFGKLLLWYVAYPVILFSIIAYRYTPDRRCSILPYLQAAHDAESSKISQYKHLASDEVGGMYALPQENIACGNIPDLDRISGSAVLCQRQWSLRTE